MTRICVAGGTGQVGRLVVRQALAAGHAVADVCRRLKASDRSKYLRAGLNLAPGERHGTETFAGWLAKNADSL